MNAAALLALISDLYSQLTTAQQRIAELEQVLAQAASGPVPTATENAE